jgi:1-aminocyclopropane-1-carboxylate deaminase/D-cysteine desulfhydrase-like pyridoxal-dependent ACC family enzyme
MLKKLKTLYSYVSLIPHSRVHSFKTLTSEDRKVFIKRDDDLGFGVSGSKFRKYQSLLPALLKGNIKSVILIGGAYSNNVLSLAQLLIENKIDIHLFLRGDSTQRYVGNLLLISLLIPAQRVHWVSREDWPEVEKTAKQYSLSLPTPTLIIPEGAHMLEALPGALTLAFDILENEKALSLCFDHIFIEAGTGLTAIALIIGLAWLKRKTCVHILLLAETKDQFLEKLGTFLQHFSETFHAELSSEDLSVRLEFYQPTVAPSFGSVSSTVFENIIKIARNEGVITDPIYSAKLFYEATHLINEGNIKGNILLIHGGGGLSLMGYQDQLYKALKKDEKAPL